MFESKRKLITKKQLKYEYKKEELVLVEDRISFVIMLIVLVLLKTVIM